MPTVYIALGSNLGDRLEYLRKAVRRLNALPSTRITGASPVYESVAMTLDGSHAPPYLNAVVRLETGLEPEQLLDYCLHIERESGRVRKPERKWESRSLDLDILAWNGRSIDTPRLVIPHPGMAERRFVLEPLFDLAPELHLPDPFDVSVRYLLSRCRDGESPDRLDVRLLEGTTES